MPRKLPGITVALLFVVVLSPIAFAQDALSPTNPSAPSGNEAESTKPADSSLAPAPSGSRVQYVGPDTYILLDIDGRPQPLPGMTYEDFLAAWKKLNQPQIGENKPAFTIDRLTFKGSTRDQRVELEFEATVHLLADGRATVPLGLAGAILQGEPRFGNADRAEATGKSDDGSLKKQPDDEFLTYDPDQGGFIAHLAGRIGERRTISFGLIVPLVHDGAETTLPLNCPRALSSQLNLTIDSAISAVRASGGAVLSQEATSAGETTVRVAGPAGLFRLTWQTAGKDSPALASVLHALGTVRVTIDGRGIRSDARLTVRSYGGSFDQFRVRLPAGAQLVPSRSDASGRQDAGFRIRVEPDLKPAQEGEARRQIAVVELPEKQQGPIVVDLSTEQSNSVEDRGQEVNLAGFDVLGAVRQFGDIALKVADDWQARWTIGSYVRQVDPSELDTSLQTPNPTAAFQYDRQPWSLIVRVTQRQLRVHVTPQFDVECLPDETRLAVRLAYQVFGARAFEFRVDLNGWEITGDPVESGGLVDLDRVVVTPEGALVLPLAQASSRRAEIAFSLRRSISRDTPRLELPLPVPLADSVGTGELTVRSTPDIELLPDLANSVGLVPAPSLPVEPNSSGDENGRLHFRTLLPTATFVTDRSARPRDVLTDSATQIEMQPDGVQVDERVNYIVRFEPIGELVFEMPEEMAADADRLELQLITTNLQIESKSEDSGTPLHVSPSDDESVLSLAGLRQFRVMLPRPQIGRFAVRIRYRLPVPVSAADLNWPVPLIHAVDGKLTNNHAVVRSPRNVAVALDTSGDENSWRPTSLAGESDARSTAFTCSTDAPELFLPLSIHYGRADSAAVTAVERVWLQTWISNNAQQDRAAFRFRSAVDQVTVELPPAAAEFEILIDKEPAEIVARAPGRVVVRVPQPNGIGRASGVAAPTTHTLELRYRQAHPRNLLARYYLTPPQIEGSTALSHVYWHVVLPADEHIVYSPQQLTSASQWQWLGAFWGRQPLKSQTDLETWVGAVEQPTPIGGQSEYLFTGLMPVASIELVTMPRWLIVLAASAAVLAMSTVWLYLPKARRSWLLTIAATVILVAAVMYPTAAMLLAQASIIGVVLAALSLLLTRLFSRPARLPLVPVVSPSSQRMVTPRTDSMLLQPVMSAASTSPTATLRASDSQR